MKCPICKRYFKNKKEVLSHMDSRHHNEIPENMSPAKYYYALNHNGETTGKCRVCSDPTMFDETTGRVKVLCGEPKCKAAFAKIARDRNIKKYGVPHLLNDQNHQMYMLSKRRISGEYRWSEGDVKVPYVGSYERRFLEFLDNFLDFDPTTIHAPSPINIYYEYEGETLAHTPDFYIDIIDLLVEIKHGGDNPNTHPKFQAVDVKKDKAKEAAIRERTGHNYIKIVDNDFKPFIELMFKLKENEQLGGKNRMVMINESILTPSPVDDWLINMERNMQSSLGVGNHKNLYFIFFGDSDTEDIDEILICVSTEDNFDNLIVLDGDRFRKLTKDEVEKIESSYITTYKYYGSRNVQSELDKLMGLVQSGETVTYPTAIDAYADIFPTVFDKKLSYTTLDILSNTNIHRIRDKYTGKRQIDTQFLGLLY